MKVGLIDLNYFAEAAHTSVSSGVLDKIIPAGIGVVLGFGLNKMADYYKDQKQINRSGEDFINELHLLTIPVKNQILSLENAIQQLEIKDKVAPLKLESHIPLDMDRFKTIDRLLVYKFFEKKNKDKKECRKLVNKLYAIIRVLEFENKQIEEQFIRYFQVSQAEYEIFNSGFNSLYRTFADHYVKNEKNGIETIGDEYISALFDILKDPKELNSKDMIEIANSVCKPIIEINAKHRFDPRTELINNSVMKCWDSYKKTMGMKKDLVYQYNHIKTRLGERLKDIEEFLNEK